MNGATAWTVRIVEVGEIPNLPVSLYIPSAPPEQRISVPCYAYILRDDDGRTAVVDTGFSPSRSTEAGHHVVGDPVAALLGALSQLGVSPQEVSLVTHTHLHYDHAQNDHLFPNAEIVIARRELQHALSAEAGEFYDGVDELVDWAGSRLRLVDGEQELAPGLRVVPNGGHTPGHQSIVVDTGDAAICICGDIVSLRANLHGPVGPICPDAPAVHAFVERINTENWEPLPSHEPDLREHRLYQPHRSSKEQGPSA